MLKMWQDRRTTRPCGLPVDADFFPSSSLPLPRYFFALGSPRKAMTMSWGTGKWGTTGLFFFQGWWDRGSMNPRGFDLENVLAVGRKHESLSAVVNSFYVFTCYDILLRSYKRTITMELRWESTTIEALERRVTCRVDPKMSRDKWVFVLNQTLSHWYISNRN